jgi:hypothetical protein
LNITKALGSEDRIKGLILDSASLLEAEMQLPEPTDMIRSTHLKFFWLLDVDFLFQGAIEICIEDVHRA